MWRVRAQAWWQALWHTGQLDAAMHDEMRFHVDMEAERLMRERGLPSDEARRQAHIAFGGLEKFKEAGRDTRGRRWLDAVSLDTRLGVRMLVKHRGLTIVGGFAMAVAIGIGATFFELVSEALNPVLPLEDGERVVALQFETADRGSPERRVIHDFVALRDELTSVQPLAAFRTIEHNLVSGEAPPEPVKVAEITAAGFAVTRTPPLIGRYLLPEDERDGAVPVLLIGYHAWQTRFFGDARIVGRTVHLGGVQRTVVGVMPEGFRFPVDHQFWMPLRVDPLAHQRLDGPALYLFGRLRPGTSLREAQAELTAVGQRTAAAYPETHRFLRPVLIAYPREHLDITQPLLVWLFRLVQVLVGVLTFVVSVNLAILVYARTVTRLGEIAVRTALGASRRRILAQLFIEALALALTGAAAGLVLAHVALARIGQLIPANGSVPYWLEFNLSFATVLCALALSVVSAVVMGVLPGLKATGRQVIANLHDANARSGTRLGPVWTGLVVAQVALAVAALPAAVYVTWQVVQMELTGPGFEADTFVVASATFSDEAAADAPGVANRQRDLMARLEAEPGVSAVTFSSSVPGFAPDRRVELEHATGQMLDVAVLDVDVDLFTTYGAEILSGRGFDAGDVGARRVVVVNRTFAERFFAGRNPLGSRFRYSRARREQPDTTTQPELYEIVGVVADFPRFPRGLSAEGQPVVYHAAAAGSVHPVVLTVRFSGAIPSGVADRIRALGAEIDPAMQLRRVVALSAFYDDVRALWRYIAWGIALVTASVLLLSAAGIYALMAFTVAQRTREIGIRTALGAEPRRVLLNVFAGALRQLGVGMLAGSALSIAALSLAGLTFAQSAMLLAVVAVLIVGVGLMAATGPARRGLRVAQALRADF